jgi:hypothetical protein
LNITTPSFLVAKIIDQPEFRVNERCPMSLRMADGPVANLPPGLDAYAGYVDRGGIGITWPGVAAIPARYHLSISIHGQAPAMCGDVEKGALTSWAGYTYGYCSISYAQGLINAYGRPKKLWIAHYGEGPHLCTSACGYGFKDRADGTQWIDHGGWDESLLADDFFQLSPPAPIPNPAPSIAGREDDMLIIRQPNGAAWLVAGGKAIGIPDGADLAAVQAAGVGVANISQAFAAEVVAALG